MDEGVQAAGAMLYVLSESVMLATDLLVATVKTTGSTGKAVAAMLAAHWKNSTQKEMGEISLKAMVRRKEPFDMLAMDTVMPGNSGGWQIKWVCCIAFVQTNRITMI